MEVQRISCVAAAGLEHRATENVSFHGFVIPKGTSVFRKIVQVGIKVQIGRILKVNKSTGCNEAVHVGILGILLL